MMILYIYQYVPNSMYAVWYSYVYYLAFSTRVDEGKKVWSRHAMEMQGTHRSGEGGEVPATCIVYMTPATRRDGAKKGEDN